MQPDPPSVDWGFSTLGCHDLSLTETLDLAKRFEVQFIEIRALADRLDIAAYLNETYGGFTPVCKLIADAGIQIRALNSGFQLCASSPEDRAELEAFASLADALTTPYIRIFGGGQADRAMTSSELDLGCDHLSWWKDYKAKSNISCDLLLETHDGFSSSPNCELLLARQPSQIGFIWDTHHTWKLGGEALDKTWHRIGGHVKHVHIKDSISVPSARHPYTYVQLGEGEFPLNQALEVLHNGGYRGGVSVEWERKWHPYLPPLDTALLKARSLGWW